MSVVTICVPSIIPTYASLYDLFTPYSDTDISWPSQLTVPTPIWDTLSSGAAELEITVSEMLNSQLAGVLSALLDPLTVFLGLDLSAILPDIQGFPDVTLIEILDGTALSAMIEAVQVPGFDFSLIALLPTPIYGRLSTLAREVLTSVQTAINGYYQTMLTLISDLIAMVTDDLMLPGMPALPAFPTLDDVLDLLPPFPTYQDLLDLELPAFGKLLESMPDPLIPKYNSPSYDLSQGLKNLWTAISNYVLQIITDFVDSLPLSFDFPVFCLSFNVPDVP